MTDASLNEEPGTLDELALVIGHDAAMALCRVYGGQPLYLPRIVGRKDRDAAIISSLRGGMTQAQAAGYYGLHVRQVRRIAAKHRNNQQD